MTHHQISQYLNQFGEGISLELTMKRNMKESRGHGKIFCKDLEVASLLLSQKHSIGKKRIIIEEMKDSEALTQKYRDLQARQIKIIISLPSIFKWTPKNFQSHFKKFGRIENANLQQRSLSKSYKREMIGNITFFRAEDATNLISSQDSYIYGYEI